MGIATIVEGDGEVQALPLLIRRICQDEFASYPHVPPPIRIHRDSFLRQADYRERYLTLARGKAQSVGAAAILVLLDGDEDCLVAMCQSCQPSIAAVANGMAYAMVVARVEFESWFLGAIDTVVWGDQGPLLVPDDPEGVKNPKAWLKSKLRPGRTYSETVDQPALAAQFDWRAARGRCRSLDKLCRELGAWHNIGVV